MKGLYLFNGSIDTPPRSSPAGTAIVILVVAIFSLTMVAPEFMGKWTFATIIVLMPLAILFRAIYAIHITLLALIWVLLVGFVPSLKFWPLSILVPLFVYSLIVILTPPLRNSFGWLRKGRFGKDVFLLVITTIVVSGVALVVWVVVEKPDLNRYLALIPKMPFWVYPLGWSAICFLCRTSLFGRIPQWCIGLYNGFIIWDYVRNSPAAIQRFACSLGCTCWSRPCNIRHPGYHYSPLWRQPYGITPSVQRSAKKYAR